MEDLGGAHVVLGGVLWVFFGVGGGGIVDFSEFNCGLVGALVTCIGGRNLIAACALTLWGSRNRHTRRFTQI